MFSKKSILLLTLITASIIQLNTQAMKTETQKNLGHYCTSFHSNFSFYSDLPITKSKETIFFETLLHNDQISLFTDHLLDLPENLRFKNISSPEHFNRCINVYLYQNQISLPKESYDLFCNPLKGNNLIQLIYYAHQAGLSTIEIEKIRLLSLAVYAPNEFYDIAHMQTAIKTCNADLIADLTEKGIKMNWVVTYAGKSQFHRPLYHYAVILNQDSQVQNWCATIE